MSGVQRPKGGTVRGKGKTVISSSKTGPSTDSAFKVGGVKPEGIRLTPNAPSRSSSGSIPYNSGRNSHNLQLPQMRSDPNRNGVSGEENKRLIEDVEDALIQHNENEVISKIVESIRFCIRTMNSKRTQASILALLWLCKTYPHLFRNRMIVDELVDVLSPSPTTMSASPRFNGGTGSGSATKTDVTSRVLACNLLLYAHHSVATDWPQSFARAYIDDAISDRLWVDHELNRIFVDNLIVQFATPALESNIAAATTQNRGKKPKLGAHAQRPIKEDLSALFHMERDNSHDISADRTRSLPQAVPVGVKLRFTSMRTRTDIAQYAEEQMKRILPTAISGLRPGGTQATNVLRCLAVLQCYGSLRVLFASLLGVLLNNQSTVRVVREVVCAAFVNQLTSAVRSSGGGTPSTTISSVSKDENTQILRSLLGVKVKNANLMKWFTDSVLISSMSVLASDHVEHAERIYVAHIALPYAFQARWNMQEASLPTMIITPMRFASLDPVLLASMLSNVQGSVAEFAHHIQNMLLENSSSCTDARWILRQIIVKHLYHKFDVMSFVNVLIRARPKETSSMDFSSKAGYAMAILDLLTYVVVLMVSPQAVEEYRTLETRGREREKEKGNRGIRRGLGSRKRTLSDGGDGGAVSVDEKHMDNTPALNSLHELNMDVQLAGLNWLNSDAALLMPVMHSGDYTPAVQKLLFQLPLVEYIRADQENEPKIDLNSLNVLTNRVPMKEEALLNLLRMGLEPANAARATRLTRVQCLDITSVCVYRALSLHAVAYKDVRSASIRITGPEIAHVLMISLLRLSVFEDYSEETPDARARPVMVCLKGLYYQALLIAVQCACANPETMGVYTWEQYPEARHLMQMLITQRFVYRPLLCGGDVDGSAGGVDLSMCDNAENDDDLLIQMKQEKDMLISIERARAAKAGPVGENIIVTESNSVLLAAKVLVVDGQTVNRPPEAFVLQFRAVSADLGLGEMLCACRKPNFLLDTMNDARAHTRLGDDRVGAVEGVGTGLSDGVTEWLHPLVRNDPTMINLLPDNVLARIMLISHKRLSVCWSGIGPRSYSDRKEVVLLESMAKHLRLFVEDKVRPHLKSESINTSHEEIAEKDSPLSLFLDAIASPSVQQRWVGHACLFSVLNDLSSITDGDEAFVLAPDSNPGTFPPAPGTYMRTVNGWLRSSLCGVILSTVKGGAHGSMRKGKSQEAIGHMLVTSLSKALLVETAPAVIYEYLHVLLQVVKAGRLPKQYLDTPVLHNISRVFSGRYRLATYMLFDFTNTFYSRDVILDPNQNADSVNVERRRHAYVMSDVLLSTEHSVAQRKQMYKELVSVFLSRLSNPDTTLDLKHKECANCVLSYSDESIKDSRVVPRPGSELVVFWPKTSAVVGLPKRLTLNGIMTLLSLRRLVDRQLGSEPSSINDDEYAHILAELEEKFNFDHSATVLYEHGLAVHPLTCDDRQRLVLGGTPDQRKLVLHQDDILGCVHKEYMSTKITGANLCKMLLSSTNSEHSVMFDILSSLDDKARLWHSESDIHTSKADAANNNIPRIVFTHAHQLLACVRRFELYECHFNMRKSAEKKRPGVEFASYLRDVIVVHKHITSTHVMVGDDVQVSVPVKERLGDDTLPQRATEGEVTENVNVQTYKPPDCSAFLFTAYPSSHSTNASPFKPGTSSMNLDAHSDDNCSDQESIPKLWVAQGRGNTTHERSIHTCELEYERTENYVNMLAGDIRNQDVVDNTHTYTNSGTARDDDCAHRRYVADICRKWTRKLGREHNHKQPVTKFDNASLAGALTNIATYGSDYLEELMVQVFCPPILPSVSDTQIFSDKSSPKWSRHVGVASSISSTSTSSLDVDVSTSDGMVTSLPRLAETLRTLMRLLLSMSECSTSDTFHAATSSRMSTDDGRECTHEQDAHAHAAQVKNTISSCKGLALDWLTCIDPDLEQTRVSLLPVVQKRKMFTRKHESVNHEKDIEACTSLLLYPYLSSLLVQRLPVRKLRDVFDHILQCVSTNPDHVSVLDPDDLYTMRSGGVRYLGISAVLDFAQACVSYQVRNLLASGPQRGHFDDRSHGLTFSPAQALAIAHLTVREMVERDQEPRHQETKRLSTNAVHSQERLDLLVSVVREMPLNALSVEQYLANQAQTLPTVALRDKCVWLLSCLYLALPSYTHTYTSMSEFNFRRAWVGGERTAIVGDISALDPSVHKLVKALIGMVEDSTGSETGPIANLAVIPSTAKKERQQQRLKTATKIFHQLRNLAIKHPDVVIRHIAGFTSAYKVRQNMSLDLFVERGYHRLYDYFMSIICILCPSIFVFESNLAEKANDHDISVSSRSKTSDESSEWSFSVVVDMCIDILSLCQTYNASVLSLLQRVVGLLQIYISNSPELAITQLKGHIDMVRDVARTYPALSVVSELQVILEKGDNEGVRSDVVSTFGTNPAVFNPSDLESCRAALASESKRLTTLADLEKTVIRVPDLLATFIDDITHYALDPNHNVRKSALALIDRYTRLSPQKAPRFVQTYLRSLHSPFDPEVCVDVIEGLPTLLSYSLDDADYCMHQVFSRCIENPALLPQLKRIVDMYEYDSAP
eukprot:CFRG5142T1